MKTPESLELLKQICVAAPSSTYFTKQKDLRRGRSFCLEGPVGLEPTTPCLKGRCSNRLSYGPDAWQLTTYIIRILGNKSTWARGSA